MKKEFVKPEIKSLRLRENILAGSGGNGGSLTPSGRVCRNVSGEFCLDVDSCNKITIAGLNGCSDARQRVSF